jgi:hypothetical protein
MDTLVNASFTSPLANVNLKIPISGGDGGFLTAFYNGFDAWTVALTFLLTLVVYDQCALYALSRQSCFPYRLTANSQIHMAERVDCRTSMENTIHWALP